MDKIEQDINPNLHARIAKELVKELKSDKDMNVIINQEKVFAILEKLNLEKDSYTPIHLEISGENKKEVEKLVLAFLKEL